MKAARDFFCQSFGLVLKFCCSCLLLMHYPKALVKQARRRLALPTFWTLKFYMAKVCLVTTDAHLAILARFSVNFTESPAAIN